ncbi:putative small multi-drug export related protein, partial [Tanacetum coccineum]
LYAFSPSDAKAQVQGAVKSIKASSFGLKFANFLRGSGWPDEAVVFALAITEILFGLANFLREPIAPKYKVRHQLSLHLEFGSVMLWPPGTLSMVVVV